MTRCARRSDRGPASNISPVIISAVHQQQRRTGAAFGERQKARHQPAQRRRIQARIASAATGAVSARIVSGEQVQGRQPWATRAATPRRPAALGTGQHDDVVADPRASLPTAATWAAGSQRISRVARPTPRSAQRCVETAAPARCAGSTLRPHCFADASATRSQRSTTLAARPRARRDDGARGDDRRDGGGAEHRRVADQRVHRVALEHRGAHR